MLVGDGDVLTPPELSAELADGIPDAGLVVVADSGHLSTLDQPEQVTQALVALAPSLSYRGPLGTTSINSR